MEQRNAWFYSTTGQCAGAQWRRPQGQNLVSGAEDGVERSNRWSKETTSLEMVGQHSVEGEGDWGRLEQG
jgi:hypothetical protein